MRTTATDQSPLEVPSSFPTLHILHAADERSIGRSLPLRAGSTPIGRDVGEDEGIPLGEDERASRLHARVELASGPAPTDGERPAVRILDLGSKNGTFVNGAPITLALLQEGQVIRVGNTLLLLRYQPARRLDAEAGLLRGSSPAMRWVRYQLLRVAPEAIPVLLRGETGVGKELAARTVHQASGRRGRLVAVNCAALAESLAESLLFGHERGAFSGATTAQDGFFRAAEGGTLFLDEVGELPLPLQPKLLRALQEHEVTPVGSTRTIPLNVRLVSATNCDLIAAVEEGRFRADLYARLRGEEIALPPLRERREDILPLFLGAFTDSGVSVTLTPRLAEALLIYDWPYNVRELLQLAQALRPHLKAQQLLDLPQVGEHLAAIAQRPKPPAPQPRGRPSSEPAELDRAAEDSDEKLNSPRLSREILERLMEENAGNLSQVARLVGRSRRQVSRWLLEHGIGKKPRKG